MPVVYQDEQAPVAQYMLLTGLLLGGLAVIRWFKIDNSLLWLDLVIILCIQVLFPAAPKKSPGIPPTGI